MLQAMTGKYRVLRFVRKRQDAAIVSRITNIYTNCFRNDWNDILLVSFISDSPCQILLYEPDIQLGGICLRASVPT
jgi:hypothetical protein